MWLRSLSLTDYRSYPQADIDLSPGVTCFVGPNGQGKTNIVEAVHYLATLRSHRVANDAPLVRDGATSALIRAQVQEDDRHVSIDLQINPGSANRARINRASTTARAREILGIVRVVMFAPEDLEIVKGDPSSRRQFLDDILIQRSPRMAGVKADYERVVKQRNALLKQASQAPRKRRSAASEPDPYLESTLQVWDEQLCTLGATITTARIALVNELEPHVAHRYADVASGGTASSDVSLHYLAKCLSEESNFDLTSGMKDEDFWRAQLAAEVAKRRSDEIQRGVSLVGPHRDELIVNLGPYPVKGYASHGETWSTVLALRLASADVLRSDGVDPILILDDVFAELDTKRRERLALMALEATQTLITAAVAEDIPTALDGARFSVRRGEVTGEVA